MEDDMIVCNFPNCDEGGNHSFPPVFVDDVGASVGDSTSPKWHLDKAYPKQVNNDEDVGVRKKLDHTAGNLKKQGEAIWVPKKMLLSHPLRMRGVDSQDSYTSQVVGEIVTEVPLMG
ncbi:hypothetical protein V6N12_045209 [Hibiscus sabdariffa]|uniref:Uncharacterized protein n=1 Tax=Hibiscus sabdariffa TaxID=183260 RepID=A0ABR2G2K9_9ROSI